MQAEIIDIAKERSKNMREGEPEEVSHILESKKAEITNSDLINALTNAMERIKSLEERMERIPYQLTSPSW